MADYGALVAIDTDLDCIADVSELLSPCEAPYNLLILNRSDPMDDSVFYPGTRPVDGYLDVIDTEIIQMCMAGGYLTFAAAAGPDEVGPNVLGAIAEVEPERAGEYPADGFWDSPVQTRFSIGGGPTLYTQDTFRLETQIDCVPPADAHYMAPAVSCLPLYTSPVPGQGEHVANLIGIEVWVNPAPAPVEQTSWGMIKGIYR